MLRENPNPPPPPPPIPKSRYPLFFILLVLPVLLMGSVSLLWSYRDLTAAALSQRRGLAHLAALTLKERFDRLSDVGVSLAARVQFRRSVSEGRWSEALHVMREVPERFPYVHRIILADLRGVLRTDLPAIPGAIGLKVGHRNWHRVPIATGKPHVSELYIRTVEPRYAVVAVSVPVEDEARRQIGVVMFQIKADVLFEWSREIQMGDSGSIYFTDPKGSVAGDPPAASAAGVIPDFSSVPVVRKVLRGEAGAELAQDGGETTLVTYEPVPGYGWGVVARQPAARAFAARDRQLRRMAAFYVLILLFHCALAYRLIYELGERRKGEEIIGALNRDLEAFCYSVSHDLKAPLRGIDGFSKILREEHLPNIGAEGARLLEMIGVNVRRMGRLIDDLLDFSRLGRKSLESGVVDMGALVNAAVVRLRAQEPQRAVVVEVKPLPRARGDEALLQQAVDNLVSNAWKFTGRKPGARIEIGTLQRPEGPIYYVADNGAGFDMRYYGKLFGVFQRLHGPDEFEGSGVGLALVERIITRHGGRIWAEGRPGEGATFYFTLPVLKGRPI